MTQKLVKCIKCAVWRPIECDPHLALAACSDCYHMSEDGWRFLDHWCKDNGKRLADYVGPIMAVKMPPESPTAIHWKNVVFGATKTPQEESAERVELARRAMLDAEASSFHLAYQVREIIRLFNGVDVSIKAKECVALADYATKRAAFFKAKEEYEALRTKSPWPESMHAALGRIER